MEERCAMLERMREGPAMLEGMRERPATLGEMKESNAEERKEKYYMLEVITLR